MRLRISAGRRVKRGQAVWRIAGSEGIRFRSEGFLSVICGGRGYPRRVGLMVLVDRIVHGYRC